MVVDENAVVLDFLMHGKSTGFKQKPIAQVLGSQFFTLLEVVPREGIELKPGQRVYIGSDERKEVEFIKRRLSFRDLTSTAVAEIDKIVESLVVEQEARFVDFFNNSRPITIRRHQLELLPGLGKKHMLEVLKERERTPFVNFKEIEERVPLMPNVVKTIVKRILEELEDGEEKHFLFAKPFAREEKRFGDRQGFGRRRDFRDRARHDRFGGTKPAENQ